MTLKAQEEIYEAISNPFFPLTQQTNCLLVFRHLLRINFRNQCTGSISPRSDSLNYFKEEKTNNPYTIPKFHSN